MRTKFQFALALCLMFAFVSCKNDSATTTTTDVKDTKTNVAPKADAKPAKKGYQIGDTVEDFKLENIDGSMVSLENYKDEKGVIVIFSCNSCPAVVAYEDRMNDLHNTYASQGYPVLAINPNDIEIKPEDDMPSMQKRAKEKGFKFAYVFDEKQEVYPKFGATRTPEVYLLKNDGTGAMTVAYTGAIDDNRKKPKAVNVKYVEDAIAAVSAGKSPNPDFTKAIGCTIKVKKKACKIGIQFLFCKK